MFDDLCINTEHTHSRIEPLSLLEILLMFWLPKRWSLGYISRRQIAREAAREAGIPVRDRDIMNKRQGLYILVAKVSVIIGLFSGIALLMMLIFWHSSQ